MGEKPSYEELQARVGELEQVVRDRSGPHGSESDFFVSLDRVNRAMQGTSDLHQVMQDVLDVVLSVFGCDRAFLLYPCESDATSFEVPMERTVPRYPGAFELGVSVPTTPEVRATFGASLATDGALHLSIGDTNDPEAEPWKTYEIKTLLGMALRPRTGKPWMFGLHQCSHVRAWSDRERQLFLEIGRRLADGLNTLLMYRDLQQREGLLTTMFENIPNAIFVKDAQTLKLVRCNRAAEQLLGYTRQELLEKTNYDVFPEDIAARYTAHDRQVLATKRLDVVPEVVIDRRDGRKRQVHTTKVPILDEQGAAKYLYLIVEDTTERRSLQAQLQQSQKLESIGRLAGGEAHDLNNMLTVIIANTDIVLAQVDPGQPLFRRLEDVRQAAERSAALTQQLLAFARKQTVAPRVLDLNATLSEMIKLLRLLIGSHIELAFRPAAELWQVRIDPSQIDQVLTNLCVNARDAIEGNGTIAIETSNVTIDEAYCARHSGSVPGDYVRLRVSDDGCGMDQGTLGQIFEPFFTTREVGKGTGLGLAIVYGIVSQNAGFIEVESEPGRGTTFTLHLPRQSGTDKGVRRTAAAVSEPAGRETILVVEDEPSLLALVGLMLQRLGYRVLAAARPSEALRLAKEHDGELHLIITDVLMPEMNGPTLARQVAALHPAIRCLFMSGYMDDVLHQGVVEENVHLIQKPFSMQSFGAKVRVVLDSDAYQSPFAP